MRVLLSAGERSVLSEHRLRANNKIFADQWWESVGKAGNSEPND